METNKKILTKKVIIHTLNWYFDYFDKFKKPYKSIEETLPSQNRQVLDDIYHSPKIKVLVNNKIRNEVNTNYLITLDKKYIIVY